MPGARERLRRVALRLVVGAAVLLVPTVRAGAADAVVLLDEGFAAIDLACPANGQAVHCLAPRTGEIVAVDPFRPTSRRTVVGPCPADGPRPVAIACLDTNTLAALCRAGAAWSIRTWRLRPDGAADFAAPLQEVPLGAGGERADVAAHLLVATSRDWLAVTGLPADLPPLVRGAIAGTRLGRFSDRSCPPAGAGPVVAVAVNPLDEIVLFTARGAQPAPRVSFHGPSGRLLLDLDCGVPAVRDAACCGTDGTLWVVGGDDAQPDRPPGLWRLDAAVERGRQVVRPVCVCRLADPRAVACVAHSAVVVAHGEAGRSLVRFDLVPRQDAPERSSP